MALTANFTVSDRVGDGVLTVYFQDTSVGPITSRKWVLGDGTVVEGNETEVGYTYTTPGMYSVTLVVSDGTSQDSKTLEDYIVVNAVYHVPQLNFIESCHEPTGRYWRLYIDADGYLVYEDQYKIYRSEHRVLQVKRWTFLEFHSGSKTMYIGTGQSPRTMLTTTVSDNMDPVVVTETRTSVCRYSTMKIDELTIWKEDRDLASYFRDLRGRAILLDRT